MRCIYFAMSAALDKIEEAAGFVLVPPPIQGIGNSGGFTMQIEVRDGSSDFQKLAAPHADRDRRCGRPERALPRRLLVPRRGAAARRGGGPRQGGDSCRSRWARCSTRWRPISAPATSRRSTSSGAHSRSMCRPTRDFRILQRQILLLPVRTPGGQMVPLGTLVKIDPTVGPSLITPLQPLSRGDRDRLAGAGIQLGRGAGLMDADRAPRCRRASAMNGRRCRTRRSRSAGRSI